MSFGLVARLMLTDALSAGGDAEAACRSGFMLLICDGIAPDMVCKHGALWRRRTSRGAQVLGTIMALAPRYSSGCDG